jgi:hypothetical protein
MFHCGCNLPPAVKLDQARQRTTRMLQNLTQLQSVELTRLKTNANLQCAAAHEIESRFRKVSARDVDPMLVMNLDIKLTLSQELTRSETTFVHAVNIGAGREKRVRNRRRLHGRGGDQKCHVVKPISLVHICSSGKQ